MSEEPEEGQRMIAEVVKRREAFKRLGGLQAAPPVSTGPFR
jgi:hypothetical protein